MQDTPTERVGGGSSSLMYARAAGVKVAARNPCMPRKTIIVRREGLKLTPIVTIARAKSPSTISGRRP